SRILSPSSWTSKMAAAFGQIWPRLKGSSGSPHTERASTSTARPQTASHSMQVWNRWAMATVWPADLSTPVSALWCQAVPPRTAAARVLELALAMSLAVPSAAQERAGAPSLAVLDLAVEDRSPISDPAATRAELASSGKTPAARLAEALVSYDAYQLVDPSRVAAALQGECSGATCALAAGKALSA